MLILLFFMNILPPGGRTSPAQVNNFFDYHSFTAKVRLNAFDE